MHSNSARACGVEAQSEQTQAGDDGPESLDEFEGAGAFCWMLLALVALGAALVFTLVITKH